MTDVLDEKDEYARTLEQAGYLTPEKKDDAPAQETNTDAPAETNEPAAAKHDAAAPEAAQPETPTVDEPFPGFSSLSADAQKAAKAKLDELTAQRAEFENRWKAQHGQLAPTQRELEQLRRQLRVMSERQHEQRPTPTGAPRLSDEFRKNYPDEAAVFDAMAGHFDESLKAVRQQNEELRAQLHGVAGTVTRGQQISTLSQRHPDWQEIDNSEPFKAWLKDAGDHKQSLARSSDANDVAEVIDDYKRDLALARFIVSQEKTATTSTVVTPTKKPEVDPNPIQRQSARSAPNAGLSEADDYVATLQAAGYKV
jgi:hypothetical protein